ncbi:MAG: PAS-domain containing protein [Alphaproteobacteria bacterium]|nr:PAS-domain containing protein [Alphaproteobacteria bacterium]
MDIRAIAPAVEAPAPWEPTDDFALLDAMPASTAILDCTGRIIAVSESWRQFALSNGYRDATLGVGRNYLEICRAADDPAVAAKVGAGITQILAARRSGFSIDYACHAPSKQRWFRLHAAPIAFKQELGALVMHTDITDEFLARRDLRRGIRRFQEVAEIVSDWLWETDTALRFTYLSDRFAEIVGIPVREATFRAFDDVFAFVDGPEDVGRLYSLLATQKKFRDETFRLRFPDGRVRLCRVSGGRIVDTKGNLRGFRGTGADITEQVEAQARADATSRRFLEAIDRMPRGITLWDEADRLIHANLAYKEIYPGLEEIMEPGLAFERLLRAILDGSYIDTGDVERETFIAQRLERRRQGSHSVTLRMRTGRWEQIASDRMSDGSLLNCHADVTELKLAEREAKEKSELLQSILDNMSEGIIVTDEDLRLVAWNGSVQAMLELPDGLLEIGAELRALSLALARRGELGPGDPEQLATDRIAFIRDNVRVVREVRLRNGRTLQARTYQMPTDGLIIVYLDITSQKQAEAHARHMQKMDAVGTLAGGISHELNNALVPIISLTQRTLKAMPERSRERENLAVVAAAAARSRDLVGKILNFSRKSGRTDGATCVADGIQAALKALAAAIPAQIGVATEIAEDVGSARIDGDELQQVVINIVTNAAQAIGDRAGSIGIEASREPPSAAHPTGLIRITVRDDGPGIPEDARQRIFEPFFTTKPVGQGTGLGLSLVHAIVASHGGRVDVESEPGAGAAFHVLLEPAAAFATA